MSKSPCVLCRSPYVVVVLAANQYGLRELPLCGHCDGKLQRRPVETVAALAVVA